MLISKLGTQSTQVEWYLTIDRKHKARTCPTDQITVFRQVTLVPWAIVRRRWRLPPSDSIIRCSARLTNMGKRIRIVAGAIEAEAELNSTATAHAIWESLPIKGRASIWGDEIYFSIPLSLELEAGEELVSMGDLGYWPEGEAFCIFFGPTPVSQANEIRPASPVAVFGKIIGDATTLKKVATGTGITVRNCEQSPEHH